MDFYPAVATKQEPTYPDVVLATESPPWDGPFPYSSSQDPSLVLPLFYLEVPPEDWDQYERWWRSTVGLDGSNILVCFGTNQVLIQDTLTLRPAEWLTDNILHYFTHSVLGQSARINSAWHLQTHFWHRNMLLRYCDIAMSLFSQNVLAFPRAMSFVPELCLSSQNTSHTYVSACHTYVFTSTNHGKLKLIIGSTHSSCLMTYF
jgi:hypothetical protein